MLDCDPSQTYTAKDLEKWKFHGASLAVVGFPVQHSISPQMHNAALRRMASSKPKYSDWRYFRFEIEAEHLVETLPLFHQCGFHGLNLTMPHKTIAFPAVEKISTNARRIGAVNTLRRSETGYDGYNTDGYGLTEGIRRELRRELEDSRIVLLGAGGAGRAAAVQCLESGCASLTIVNRNQERLDSLRADLETLAIEQGTSLSCHAPDAPDLRIDEGALIINATSLGMKPDDPLPIQPDLIDAKVDCYDMIYSPPKTRLLHLVEESGGKWANGLSMLAHQGAKSLEIWTGDRVPSDTMENAAIESTQR